jgi:two-component system, NarL family, sensor histidine kinase DesK
MSGSGRRGALAPRFAWTFAAAFRCLLLPARLSIAAYGAGPAGVAVAAALFVLPLLYTVPRGGVVRVPTEAGCSPRRPS